MGIFDIGAWLSLVERLVRDQEAESSNLSAPTNSARVMNEHDVPTESSNPEAAAIRAAAECRVRKGRGLRPDHLLVMEVEEVGHGRETTVHCGSMA